MLTSGIQKGATYIDQLRILLQDYLQDTAVTFQEIRTKRRLLFS